MTLAEKIKVCRSRLGLSQEGLASLARVGRATIVRIESGRFRPSQHTLERLAAVLRVTVAQLQGDQLPAPPSESPARMSDLQDLRDQLGRVEQRLERVERLLSERPPGQAER